MTAQSDNRVSEKITKVRKIKTTLVKEEIIVEETAKVEETTIQEIAHKEFLQLQKRLGHELLNTILLMELLLQLLKGNYSFVDFQQRKELRL